jgi:hypothetical protein
LATNIFALSSATVEKCASSKFFDKKDANILPSRWAKIWPLRGIFPWHFRLFPLTFGGFSSIEFGIEKFSLYDIMAFRSLALKIGFFLIGFSLPQIPDFPLNSISLWGWHDKCVCCWAFGEWENGPSIQIPNGQ